MVYYRSALVAFCAVSVLSTAPLLRAQAAEESNALARHLNNAFADVYEKVAPAVVVLEVQEKPGSSSANTMLPEGLEFFFRDPNAVPVPESNTNSGSGFIISKDGYILTNHHVVESAKEGGISALLKDGRKFPARVVGLDAKTDLAVLKIDATDLPVAELGDSDQVRVGQFAFAIGAPFDLPYTFTVGVVSATGRNSLTRQVSYENYIQTDASINPGNSGGPLCDLDGRVIGINTLINGFNRGLGFAVPSNMAREVSLQLIANGRVRRPWLGIEIEALGKNEMLRKNFPGVVDGVVVRSIMANAPADRSELEPGDVVLKVDGATVKSEWDLQKEILSKKIGQNVNLEIWRQGKPIIIPVKTGELPSTDSRQALRLPARPTPLQKPAPQNSGLGLQLQDMNETLAKAMQMETSEGALVTEVTAGSPAAAAGIRLKDVITELNGNPIRSAQDFEKASQGDLPDSGLMVRIQRGDKKTYAVIPTP